MSSHILLTSKLFKLPISWFQEPSAHPILASYVSGLVLPYLLLNLHTAALQDIKPTQLGNGEQTQAT